MSTVIRGANSKGSYFGDASYRTAYIRKQAICSGQAMKETCAKARSSDNQAKKPLLTEQHLSKGSTNGSMEFLFIKNPSGIF